VREETKESEIGRKIEGWWGCVVREEGGREREWN